MGDASIEVTVYKYSTLVKSEEHQAGAELPLKGGATGTGAPHRQAEDLIAVLRELHQDGELSSLVADGAMHTKPRP